MRKPWNQANGPMGTLVDAHTSPGEKLPKQGPADTFTATQYYGYHSYRMDFREPNNRHDFQFDVLTTTIKRQVYQAVDIWFYRIEKHNKIINLQL